MAVVVIGRAQMMRWRRQFLPQILRAELSDTAKDGLLAMYQNGAISRETMLQSIGLDIEELWDDA